MSLDDFQQGSVCNLGLTVCLWVGGGGIMILDSEVLTKVPEKGVVEQSPIVRYQYFGHSKPAQYILLDEVLYILLCNACQGFCFHPLSEIVNPYH